MQAALDNATPVSIVLNISGDKKVLDADVDMVHAEEGGVRQPVRAESVTKDGLSHSDMPVRLGDSDGVAMESDAECEGDEGSMLA